MAGPKPAWSWSRPPGPRRAGRRRRPRGAERTDERVLETVAAVVLTARGRPRPCRLPSAGRGTDAIPARGGHRRLGTPSPRPGETGAGGTGARDRAGGETGAKGPGWAGRARRGAGGSGVARPERQHGVGELGAADEQVGEPRVGPVVPERAPVEARHVEPGRAATATGAAEGVPFVLGRRGVRVGRRRRPRTTAIAWRGRTHRHQLAPEPLGPAPARAEAGGSGSPGCAPAGPPRRGPPADRRSRAWRPDRAARPHRRRAARRRRGRRARPSRCAGARRTRACRRGGRLSRPAARRGGAGRRRPLPTGRGRRGSAPGAARRGNDCDRRSPSRPSSPAGERPPAADLEQQRHPRRVAARRRRVVGEGSVTGGGARGPLSRAGAGRCSTPARGGPAVGSSRACTPPSLPIGWRDGGAAARRVATASARFQSRRSTAVVERCATWFEKMLATSSPRLFTPVFS